MSLSLTGVYAPAVTPFDADGALDADAFRRNVRAHRAAGLAGVVTAGSSGEAALLEDDERVRLAEWARDELGADGTVIAGVGGESTRGTVRRARDAARAGADGVLVVAPHYYARRMDDDALRAHYTVVADASPLPVLLYNIPVYAHFALSPELVAELAAHPNVAGMKDSAGDLPMLERYLASQGPTFRVLTGHAGTFATALALGVSGGILAAALFAPGVVLPVVEAHARGDAEATRAAQDRLTPLGRDVVAAYGPAGLKCALDLVGLAGAAPRAPLLPCTDAERDVIAERLAAAGVAVCGVA
ncbi:dihydrodipicolinate synthase family protein [Gemmatimonadetes bacterium T265]|nr:dihydrodipicolinate synthase family protein [Gemmatimonadetes bacterium T265]